MSEDDAVRFAVSALLEVVESEKSMEICVVRAKDAESLTEDRITSIVSVVKAERVVLHPGVMAVQLVF